MEPAAAEYEVRLLGPPAVLRHGSPVELSRRRALVIVAMALLEDRPIGRRTVAAMLWPDSEDPASNLRPVLSELRQRAPGLLEITRTAIAPPAREAVRVDVHELGRGGGHRLGPLLEGFDLDFGEAYDDWLTAERHRCAQLVGDVRRQLLAEHLAAGEVAAAIDVASADAEAAPYDDDVHHALVQLLLRAGRRTDAVAHARTFAARLQRDLGIETAGALRAIADATDPPASDVAGSPVSPAAMPVASTPIVGRDRELDQTEALLDRSRLVTITGAGGTGKTALALEAARRALVRDAASAAVVVELEDVARDDDVAHAVAARLRLSLSPEPVAGQIADYLSGLEILVVLDGCEHVLRGVAELVEAVLSAGRRPRVLATSRHPLDVTGETLLALEPLDIGASGAARQLLLQRAAIAGADVPDDPSTTAVLDEICRRLDGLPLALEVAAALLERLRPRQLLDDLDALLMHGASGLALDDIVDWSVALLSDDARDLFTCLGVFPAGFDLEAAAAIAGCSRIEATSLLEELASGSLVQHEHAPDGTARFRLLNTVAARARTLAGARGPLLDQRHAEHFWARCAGLDLFDLRDSERTGRMEPDIASLSAAFEHHAADGRWSEAVEIAIASYGVFSTHGWTQRGRDWLERCLAHEGVLGPERAQRARGFLQQLCLVLDDTAGIERHGALLADAVDLRIRAEATGTRALPLLRSDPARAAALLDAAMAAAEEAARPGAAIWPRAYTGFHAMHAGDLELALERLDTSITEALLLGHTSHLWILEDTAASCELLLGRPEAVISRLEGATRRDSFWDARDLLLGLAHLELGALDVARDEIVRFADPTQRGRLPRSANDAIVGLAHLAAHEGQRDKALDLLGSTGPGRMPASIGVGRALAARLGGTERVAELREHLAARGRLFESADDVLAREWRAVQLRSGATA